MKYITAAAPRFILRFVELQRLVAKHRIGLEGAKVAEFGPGLGDVASWLADAFEIDTLDLIEASAVAREMLFLRFGGCPAVAVRDSLGGLARNSYDVQLCFEVLEHLEDDLRFMRQINGLGAMGSYFIGSVPAYMSKWQKVDEWAGHVRRYERAELQWKLEASGFDVIELYVYGFPFTNLMYPLRQLHYGKMNSSVISKQAATLNSGIDRKSFSPRFLKATFIFLKYLSPIQRVPALKNLGDGFIFLAQKR